MKFSKRSKILLLCLLILLNIVIRIPSVPHPLGDDSFVIHILANSVSLFGYAKWWIHPLSIIGDYPYSYTSALPFFLSGISQCVGLEIEHIIWLYCVFIAIFALLIGYMMAGELIDDDLFKFLVAFGLSLSPALLAYTSWMTQSRGFFVVLTILFIYLLLKSRDSRSRYSLLIFVIILLLFSTHHYAYFIIPIIGSYFIVTAYFKLKKQIKFVKMPEIVTPLVPITALFLMYSIPFFTGRFIVGNTRYIDWASYIRYIGVFIIPAVGGLIYLIFKRDKKYGEWVILVLVISFIPFVANPLYMKFILPVFAVLLAGIGLKNALEVSGPKRKYGVVIVLILLLFSTVFSGFYQHWRTNPRVLADPHKVYMNEILYIGALWIKDNIEMDSRLIGNDYLTARRIFAISEVPTFIWDADVCLLTYGFANESDITLLKISPLSEDFYMKAPYVDVSNPFVSWYGYNLWVREELFREKVINKFNLSYVIKDTKSFRISAESVDVIRYNDRFTRRIKEKNGKIYNNGRIEVWNLD